MGRDRSLGSQCLDPGDEPAEEHLRCGLPRRTFLRLMEGLVGAERNRIVHPGGEEEAGERTGGERALRAAVEVLVPHHPVVGERAEPGAEISITRPVDEGADRPGREIGERHGTGKQIALPEGAAEQARHFKIRLVLDPFDHDLVSELPSDLHQRRNDADAVSGIGEEFAEQGLVDLHHVDRQGEQALEARISGAKVIDGEMNSPLGKLPHRSIHRRIIHGFLFEEFEGEAGGRHSHSLERIGDPARAFGMNEGGGGDVDRKIEAKAAPLPVPERGKPLGETLVEEGMVVLLAQRRQKPGGGKEGSIRPLQPGERLDLDRAERGEIADRLDEHGKPAAIEALT